MPVSVSEHACTRMLTRVCKHGGIRARVYQQVHWYTCLRVRICVHVSPRVCTRVCIPAITHPCISLYSSVCVRAPCTHTCPPVYTCVCVPPECPPLYEHMLRCPRTHVGSACCAHPYDPLNLPNFSFLPLCPAEEESTEQTSQVKACLAAHVLSGLAPAPGWGSPGALGLSKVAMGQEGGRTP